MPNFNASLEDFPLSEFDYLQQLIKNKNNPAFISFHQGKTTFSPCADLNNWKSQDFELLAHQHASPQGVDILRDLIVKKLESKYNRKISLNRVTITCGATHGVSIAVRMSINPGNEILVLSPQWLFACGIISGSGGIPIEVPVFTELVKDPNFDFISMLEKRVSANTKALYFNTPNNPIGKSFRKNDLLRLSEFAKKHDLWIISDNAYEIYDYTEEGFIDIGEISDEVSQRTFSVYTFSKTYAMPGYRVGYLLSPCTMSDRIRKMSLYSVYSISTASQFGAFQAIQTPNEILEKHHRLAKRARDITRDMLEIPASSVEGGLYTFLDLSKWKSGNSQEFIHHCIENGVSLAPGLAFGRHCSSHARLCFTAVNHADLEIGIGILNRIYKKGRQ